MHVGPVRKVLLKGRLIVRDNAFLYKSFLRLRRRYRADLWPGEGTDLCIAGYPRSANSFVYVMLQQYAPQLKVASHLHSTAAFKQALRHGVKTLVLIREPLNAVSSYILRRITPQDDQAEVLEMAVDDYIQFYDYALKHKDRFLILDFETAVNDPHQVVRRLRDDLHLALDYDEQRIDECCDWAINRWKKKDKRAPEKQNLSNPQKEAAKDSLKTLIKEHAKYAALQDVYAKVSPLRGQE